jgi:WD40 repeat protein
MVSCADKTVTLYETQTGNAVCRTTCGEVTLSMCLSTNLRHLITTSMDGVIYIWRLPEILTKALMKLKTEQNLQKKTLKTIQEDAEIEKNEEKTINKSEEFNFDLSNKEEESSKEADEEARSEPPNPI